MIAKRLYSVMVALLLSLVFACTTQTSSPAVPAVSPTATPPYPEKPVTMVVGFTAGGSVDLVARALVDAMKTNFPQPISIANKAGSSGAIGAAEVVRAKSDGYTMGLIYAGSMSIQPHITPDLPYKSTDDYLPVINVVKAPIVLGVREDSPWKTLKDFVDYAKANPGKIRYGTAGVGTLGHLVPENFSQRAKIELTHVPFDSVSVATTQLLGGHIEAVSINPGAIVAQVKGGKVRILATFDDTRSPVFADTPTGKELGYDISTDGSQQFVMLPKGTPDYIAKVVHDSVKKAMESDSFKKFADEQGYTIEYKNSSDLKQRLQKDYSFYADFLKLLNLKG